MATNLSIDPDLIDRALEVSGERTKKAAVTQALEEFIARRRQKDLLDAPRQARVGPRLRLQGRADPRLTLFVDTSVWSLAFRRHRPPSGRVVSRLGTGTSRTATRLFRPAWSFRNFLQGFTGPKAHDRDH